MGNIFYIDEVREWIRQYDKEEISLSRFVEILNEKAMGKSAIELYRAEVLAKEHDKMGCPFKYCDSKPKCEGGCRYA